LYQTVLFDALVDPTTDFGTETIYESNPDLKGWFRNTADATPMEAATWVYRNLQRLYEDNAMTEQAREFHLKKEEAEREYHRREAERAEADSHYDAAAHDRQYFVKTLNRYLTNHGESLTRLLSVWSLVILACGFLYPFVGGVGSDSTGEVYQITSPFELLTVDGWVTMLQSLYFSVITFSTIGYGDLYPIGPGSKLLVGFESLIGALLVALFVFVLGRQVAR
jgi:hypothetical protein